MTWNILAHNIVEHKGKHLVKLKLLWSKATKGHFKIPNFTLILTCSEFASRPLWPWESAPVFCPKIVPPSHNTNTTPPTPHWRHRLLYLSLNLPVPATNNAAPSNVFATNADCTSDWLYLLFATSYCTTGTAPAPPHQSLCHHRKFHRSQSCNATKSCETVQLYFKFNIFSFLGFKIKCG